MQSDCPVTTVQKILLKLLKVIALYLLYFSFLTCYNYILVSLTAGSGYGSSFLHVKLLDCAWVESSHRNPCKELVHYLSSPLKLDVTDPV